MGHSQVFSRRRFLQSSGSGTFPTLAPGGPDDTGSRGVLIPTTSLDQFGGTIARWFGVSGAMMPSVFPNLANFGAADLGFLA